MKKPIAFALVLALIIAAGATYLYWRRPRPLGDLKAAEYLPQDTVAFVEIMDWQRSKARWQETALHKIAQEPEVAAFLAKPESLMPGSDDFDRFRKLNPKEVFIAVTGQGAGGPKVIAGFDFTGKKSEAEALVKDLKANLTARFPDGKSDLQQFGSSQIETFTHGDETVGTVFKGPWFFASNDLDLLRSTLDRVEGKVDAKNSLRENENYKFCLGKLPQDSDLVAFANMKGIIDGLAMMLEASNADRSALDELRKIQAVGASMKFDGEELHDALYVYKPGGQTQPPLAFDSMAFTTPNTIYYLASTFKLEKAPVLPNTAIDKTGVLDKLNALRQAMTQAGLGLDEFKAAFGNELGVVVNWTPDALLQSGAILSLDVRDKVKAQKFIEALAKAQGGAGEWPKQEMDGALVYSIPSAAGGSDDSTVPAVALTDKALLVGTSVDAVKKAVQDAKSGTAKRANNAVYQAAGALAGKPTGAFSYLDSRAVFEIGYDLVSKFVQGMAFLGVTSPASQYSDLSKLPSAEVISKHLRPIVYSQSADENGILIESMGPVTFTEVLAVAGGAGAAYVMMGHASGQPIPFTIHSSAVPTTGSGFDGLLQPEAPSPTPIPAPGGP